MNPLLENLREDVQQSLIAILCEGSAERAIMEILLENDKLIFGSENIIRDSVTDRSTLPERSAIQFAKNYLEFDYTKPITVIRILDSKNERFKLPKEYDGKVTVYSVLTRPEIERLILIHEGADSQWQKQKSKYKPSQYCKTVLNLGKLVKTDLWIRNYWYDVEELLDSIREYARIQKLEKNELTLCDLLA